MGGGAEGSWAKKNWVWLIKAKYIPGENIASC